MAELALVVALVVAAPRGRGAGRRRRFAIAVVIVATLANLVAVALLTHFLIVGGRARGADLIDGGALIWATNLLLFAVWYWELDRGGPGPRARPPPPKARLLFPPMDDQRH